MRHSALSYLNQWFQTDQKLMAAASRQDIVKHGCLIKNLAGKYLVARNFPTSKLSEIQQTEFWEEIAQVVSSNSGITPIDRVNKLALRLGQLAPKKINASKATPSLISAASKFLWFAGDYDVQIYDKRAIVALNKLRADKHKTAQGRKKKLPEGNYEAYLNAWNEAYADYQSEIEQSVSELTSVIKWSVISGSTQQQEAIKTTQHQWFLHRVFDRFLWIAGDSKK